MRQTQTDPDAPPTTDRGYRPIRLLADDVTCKQFYWPDTNVLVTRFLSADGIGEIADYMPVVLAAMTRAMYV